MRSNSQRPAPAACCASGVSSDGGDEVGAFSPTARRRRASARMLDIDDTKPRSALAKPLGITENATSTSGACPSAGIGAATAEANPRSLSMVCNSLSDASAICTSNGRFASPTRRAIGAIQAARATAPVPSASGVDCARIVAAPEAAVVRSTTRQRSAPVASAIIETARPRTSLNSFRSPTRSASRPSESNKSRPSVAIMRNPILTAPIHPGHARCAHSEVGTE